ncbi:MAG TPA: M1 family metallopeptidase [Planctomycetota bacterium]
MGTPLTATLVLAALLPAVASAQSTPRPTNRADYRIHARLDGETERIEGQLELRWTNRSGESVRDLWFHLYLNAFSNNRSTHLLESKGKLRDKKIEDGWGWSRVRAIRVDGAAGGGFTDVMPTMAYQRPDDGNQEDRTVFSVELPQPVASGETALVQIEWEAQLPRVRRRTGHKDDFLLVAQWFPKLGVYEAGRGWNCHQFHRDTEFYADYGTYEVTLDLPIEYQGKVGASGVKVNDTPRGDRIEVRFVAPSPADQRRQDAFGKTPLVHDFTWTASPRFVVYRQTFRFKDWADLHPSEVESARAIFGEEPRLRDVDVTVLLQPEHEHQAERHFKATCAALFFYGLWFGEYPYEHVTVVDPAWGAAAGGMEYPTLFTCGTAPFTTEDMHRPESVTVHECGHQFWYGLVGNNEFEAAWLDEGFNSFTDSEVLWRVYGARRETTDYARVPVDGERMAPPPGGGGLADALALRAVGLPFTKRELRLLGTSGALEWWRDQPLFSFAPQWTDPRGADRVGYLNDPHTDPIETHGWEYADRTSYGTNSYARTATVLRTLRGLVGEPAFLRGLRQHAREGRYAHPYPADFYRAFQQGAGVDVEWYFRELFQGTGTVDWSVAVEQARRSEPRGFFQGEGGEFLERQPPEPESDDEEDGPRAPYRIEIELRREGTLCLPLPVLLTYADGSTEEKLWSREEQQTSTWKRFVLESEAKLRSVQLDPARGYWIDLDLSDNQWYDATDALAPWRWVERVLAQYQHTLHFLQGLGG